MYNNLKRRFVPGFMGKFVTVVLTLGVLSIAALHAQTINTYAGIPFHYGYDGDGGPATSAKLASPYSLAADGSGNLYIADYDLGTVRIVNSSGTINTIAGGGGTAGLAADGGAATDAYLSNISGIAVDGSGNLYIAEAVTSAVRKVNTSGIISTVAGTGSYGWSGDGSAATDATLKVPDGVTVDNAHNLLYIADVDPGTGALIRKVDMSSGNISTFYTAPTAGSDIRGLVVDGSGNVYAANYGEHAVTKITMSGTATNFAGHFGANGFGGDGGTATNAYLANPYALARDASGNIYISDVSNARVRKVTTSGTISTFAGAASGMGFYDDGYPATQTYLDGIYGIAIGSTGAFFLCQPGMSTVRYLPGHSPYFVNGSVINARVCQNAAGVQLNPMLTIRDVVSGETLAMNSIYGPYHGTCTISYSTTSTGGAIVPAGSFVYVPTPGYTGTDSIFLTVSDGVSYGSTTVRITVNPQPSAATISGSSTVCRGSTTTLTASPSGGFWGSMDGVTRTGATTGVVTGVASGVSNIYYNSPYNSYGCRTQTRTTITSLGYPAGAVLTGAATLCPGASATMSAGAGTGTWTTANAALVSITSGGTATAVASGTVNVSYTYSNACFSTINLKAIRVTGATTLGLIGGPATLTMPATITLSNPVSGGSWSSVNTSVANISSGGVVSGVAAGLDTIVYSYTNSCGITSSVSARIRVYAMGGRGANENGEITASSNTLNVYPNPTTGLVTVETVTGPLTVVVTDISGKVITTKNSDTNKAELDMSQLARGVYLLHITANNEKFMNKVVVE